MDKRVEEKKGELRDLISSTIDEVFCEAHQLVGTISGDITPEQVGQLDISIDCILEIMMEQIEQNLPEIPLTKEDVMSKFTTKKKFFINCYDFERLIEQVYGVDYDIVAEHELNNSSKFNFTVGDGDEIIRETALIEKLRKGEYIGQWNCHIIAKALYIDGYLEAGDYQIEIDW